MPDELEQLEDAGMAEGAGEACPPVFDAEPAPEPVPEPEPPPVIVVEQRTEPGGSLMTFKVNARHSNCPNRWETVEAKNEEEAKRIFLRMYTGEIIAVKPGAAEKNER